MLKGWLWLLPGVHLQQNWGLQQLWIQTHLHTLHIFVVGVAQGGGLFNCALRVGTPALFKLVN